MSPASIAGNAGARPGTRTARDAPLARRRPRAGLSSLVEIGFFFWPYEPEYTARMATLADELGFDIVFVADTPGISMDPRVAMSFCALIYLRAPDSSCCYTAV